MEVEGEEDEEEELLPVGPLSALPALAGLAAGLIAAGRDPYIIDVVVDDEEDE